MPELNTYNRPWTGMTGDWLVDQLSIECWCFRHNLTEADGAAGKFQHFWNIVELLWNNPKMGSPKQFIRHSWADKIIDTLCKWQFVAISGGRSTGKSDIIALWVLVNFIADPTHCKALTMSTSLIGAKQRIWKTLLEYYRAIPNLPGKLVESMNVIKGISYDQQTFTETSGIRLLATEQAKASESLEKLIGIKAPMTQGDDARIGSLLVAIDEMTGCAESILEAAKQNLTANKNFQLIGIANFASPFDPFGELMKPKDGYISIKDNDYEWETELGYALVLDAERSPRILENREDLHWMPSRQDIEQFKQENGPNSLAVYRFIKSRPSPKGPENTVYDAAEIIRTGSLGKAIWGAQKPVPCAFLDCAFSGRGDLAIMTFGRVGISNRGVQTLQFDEQVPVQLDVTNADVPISYQMLAIYKAECEKRGIQPRHIGFDSTGAGGPFGDIVHAQWSREVLGINSGGVPAASPVSNVNRKLACDVYANKATEIWYAAKPFFRGGQIRGINDKLAKEICSRQNAKTARGEETRKLKIEDKRVYRKREGKSPDHSDSALGLIGVAKQRLGFKPIEKPAGAQVPKPFVPEGVVQMPLPSNGPRFQIPSFKREVADDRNPFARSPRPVLRVERLRYD